MTENPLEALLEKLSEGDPLAAEEVFRVYEPYLRMVVRRQLAGELRAKFDSSDVVQSAWVDLLDGFREQRWTFQDADHLRAFLVRVTRNRFIDRLRQNAAAIEHQREFDSVGNEAVADAQAERPSEMAQANELWERMLSACSPNHQEILNLKRRGCSLKEIAAQTGYHKSSVRRILYDLARRLAVQQRDVGI